MNKIYNNVLIYYYVYSTNKGPGFIKALYIKLCLCISCYYKQKQVSEVQRNGNIVIVKL